MLYLKVEYNALKTVWHVGMHSYGIQALQLSSPMVKLGEQWPPIIKVVYAQIAFCIKCCTEIWHFNLFTFQIF